MKRLTNLINACVLLMVILLVLIVFPFGCSKKKPVSGEVVKIGVILPLTGDGAIYGTEIKEGIELAVAKINTQGGIRGKKIVAFYEDDQGSPQPAVSAFQKLVSQKGINITIGGAFSTSALATLPLCNQYQVLLFSPTASSPELSKPNDYFFRNWPSDIFEGNTMASFAVADLSLKKFAILYSNSDYGLGLREVFKKKIIQLGANIVLEDSFSEGNTDFRTQLNKIKQSEPDAIYLVGWYKEFSLILRQAREMGIKSQFLSCVTFNKPELLELAGNAAEGVFFTQPAYDPNSSESNIEQFVTDYQKRFNKVPGVYAAHGYDAVKLIALAMEKKGTTPDEVISGFSLIKDYPGVSGKTTFDLNGDVNKPARVFIVRGGKYVPFD